LEDRRSEKGKQYLAELKWESEDRLPFGVPFREIRASLAAIERGQILEERQMVYHEQVNVLQHILYHDSAVRALLDANQLAWVTELPSSVYYQRAAAQEPGRGKALD
jgi:hypothetical protein